MDKEKYFDHFLIQEMELKKGRYVFLNVYHISKINYLLKLFGLGLYHTSIDIDEIEYSFGSTEDTTCGIYINKKNESLNQLVIKERILLGITIFSDKNILELLNLHSEFWLGKSYDPFKKNCNHFTNFMAELLIKNFITKFPLYINRATEFGIFFHCFYTPIKIVYGDIIVNNNEQECLELYSKKKKIESKSDERMSIKGHKGLNKNSSYIGDINKYCINNKKFLTNDCQNKKGEKNFHKFSNVQTISQINLEYKDPNYEYGSNNIFLEVHRDDWENQEIKKINDEKIKSVLTKRKNIFNEINEEIRGANLKRKSLDLPNTLILENFIKNMNNIEDVNYLKNHRFNITEIPYIQELNSKSDHFYNKKGNDNNNQNEILSPIINKNLHQSGLNYQFDESQILSSSKLRVEDQENLEKIINKSQCRQKLFVSKFDDKY